MNDKKFGSIKFSKLKYRRGCQIIQTFLKIGSPQKEGTPSLIWRNLKTQYSLIMQNALKSTECPWIWVYKTFKIEIQKVGPNNSDFLQNWFPPQIRPPFFNL